MNEEDILRSQSLQNRQRNCELRIANCELPENQPTEYLGYDSITGRGLLKNFSGSQFYGQSITNGVVARGDMVRMRGDRFDSMPRINQVEEAGKERSLSGFIVWNTGFTKDNEGIVDRAVDFFSGILDRDNPKWQKSVSYDDEMPNIKGLKLIYIPMPNRSLSNQEVNRLKSFQRDGGIVFVTGEHSIFSTERQKANEIMVSLRSPLRCVDNNSSYSGAFSGANYPATFRSISTLYGNAACQITGGTSISVIPNSVVTPGTNILWIAYDRRTRTVLSGDIEWASATTPFNEASPPNDNPRFAKLLLKL